MSQESTLTRDLKKLLENFSFCVIRDQPTDLVNYAASYFTDLHDKQNDKRRHLSEKSAVKAVTYSTEITRQSRAVPTSAVRPNDIGCDNSPESSNKASMRTELWVSEQGDVQSAGAAEFEEEDDNVTELNPIHHTPGTLNRRQSVAAESFDPECEKGVAPAFHPKSADQMSRLLHVVNDIFLFRSLDEEQIQQVINAMVEKTVTKDEVIIKQGDDGEYFYVIESGNFDIFVNDKQAGSYQGSGSFGELALMYNTPRAATIIARTPGILWSVDRSTFRHIVLKQAFLKRQLYENLLSNVPLLTNLSSYERTSVADALVSRTYEDNVCIIRQGEHGEEMFFVEEGSVKIVAKGRDNKEKELKRLQKGSYFGELALILKEPRQASAYAVGRTKLAVLDVCSFERLLGPCLDVMKREAQNYRARLLAVVGKEALSKYPALAQLFK